MVKFTCKTAPTTCFHWTVWLHIEGLNIRDVDINNWNERKIHCWPSLLLKKVLEAFFKRALAWEKGSKEENEEAAISLSDERDGVYIYQSGHEMGVLLEGHPTKLPLHQLRSIVPGLKGFDLVMIHLHNVSTHKVHRYSLTLSALAL